MRPSFFSLTACLFLAACSSGSTDSTIAANPCEVRDVTGTIPGVKITITADRCVFKVGEGGVFHYVVTTDASVPTITVAAAMSCGSCGGISDDPSNFVSWMVGGGGVRYCFCDQGCCAPHPATTVKPRATSTAGAIEWHGRSWDGPSDFFPPEKEPFPVGKYAVTVSFEGGSRGRVEARLPIEVVP